MDSYFGLPTEVVFCTACVISNQRPSSTIEFRHIPNEKKKTIRLQADGICDACNYSMSKEEEIDWSKRKEQLQELCERYRRKSGYDVIVPGSGGKDSAYTAHVLKYEYGMNPLTVTWAPHLYTEIGWKNFINWMHVGGLDNVLFTPNGKLHRLLTRLAFQHLLHPFQPFILGQRIIGPLMAQKFGVELVMYGENQAEYGNDVKENLVPTMSQDFFSADLTHNITIGGISTIDIIERFGFTENDFAPYTPIGIESLRSAPVDVHYLGYYLKWDPQECFYYAVENTGFSPNTERTQGSYSKYSSIDDKIDPFHYFTTYIKFGLGRASYDAAQEIRNRKITRDEGVDLVQKYDHEFPTKYFAEFLQYIGMTEMEFWATVNRFRSPHLWRSVNGEWVLKHAVYSP